MGIGQHQEEFLAALLLALAGGIWLARSVGLPLWLLGMVLAGSLVLALWLLRRTSRYTWLAFLVLFAALGALRFTAVWQLPADDISHWQKQTVQVAGTLREEPRVSRDAQGQWHVRYTLDVAQVQLKGTRPVKDGTQATGSAQTVGTAQSTEAQRASGGLYVYATGEQAKKQAAGVRLGDRVQAQGKIRSPHGYQDPGQIDTVMLLRSDGITAACAAGKAGVKVTPQEPGGVAGLWTTGQRWLVQVRAHYRERMYEVMPQTDAAAIFAMLFGGYAGIKPELVAAFTTTGIVHILSVSGSHISLLAAVVAWLGLQLHLPRWRWSASGTGGASCC